MTTPKQFNDGGAAFPRKYGAAEAGMTLRDYFAAAALQGFCANPDYGSMSSKKLAAGAYGLSDAMIEVRKEGA